jgi:hypothetical protein
MLCTQNRPAPYLEICTRRTKYPIDIKQQPNFMKTYVLPPYSMSLPWSAPQAWSRCDHRGIEIPPAKDANSLLPQLVVGAVLNLVVVRLQHPKGPDSKALCEGKTEGCKLRTYVRINYSFMMSTT